MLLLLTALPELTSLAKPHCLRKPTSAVRTAIQTTMKRTFVGDANYMSARGPLSRQKNDLITRKTDLSTRRTDVQAV
jgi:hypothetical protein